MSHLEENSSFDDEYWGHGAWSSTASTPPSLPWGGPNRAPGQAFRNPFTAAPLPAPAVLANGSAVFCGIEDK